MFAWFTRQVCTTDLSIPSQSPVAGLDASRVRHYALRSSDRTAAYFRRVAGGGGNQVTIDVPVAGQGVFMDPSTGAVLATSAVQAGANQLALPAFTTDLAFFSHPGALVDTDPIAIVRTLNPQDDGDLDQDGLLDWGPGERAFGLAPLTLTFDATESLDLDGGELTFRWDFGDGTTGEGPTVVHTYEEGDFLLTLTVTDDEGRRARHGLFVRTTADGRPDRNDPPTLTEMPEVVVDEGELVLVSPLGGDRELNDGTYLTGPNYQTDDEPTIVFLDPLPEGAVFEPWRDREKARFWWVPSFEQSGTYVLRVKAVDDDGAESPVRLLRITVRDVRGTPVR